MHDLIRTVPESRQEVIHIDTPRSDIKSLDKRIEAIEDKDLPDRVCEERENSYADEANAAASAVEGQIAADTSYSSPIPITWGDLGLSAAGANDILVWVS
ncbi:hypothetical protein PG988_008027 [Apiospora saccharicola]